MVKMKETADSILELISRQSSRAKTPLRARVISLQKVLPLQKLSLAKGHGPGKAETSKTILKCTFEPDSFLIYPHSVPEVTIGIVETSNTCAASRAKRRKKDFNLVNALVYLTSAEPILSSSRVKIPFRARVISLHNPLQQLSVDFGVNFRKIVQSENST